MRRCSSLSDGRRLGDDGCDGAAPSADDCVDGEEDEVEGESGGVMDVE
jgi:hypothetical protein